MCQPIKPRVRGGDIANTPSTRRQNLHSPTTNVAMKPFQFQRVIVTGEEILDERWPNTPVINIDSIEAVPQ